MKLNKLPVTKSKPEFIKFTGGLDIMSLAVELAPGLLRAGQNIEEDINGGYASLTGYERFDGHPAPSSVYGSWLIGQAASTDPAHYWSNADIGTTITGATSGATAYIMAIDRMGLNPSPPYPANSQYAILVLINVTGTWSAGGEYIVGGGGAPNGKALSGTPSHSNDISSLNALTYNKQYSDILRAAITSVGVGVCSGSVLGVWYYKGTVYAFRNLTAGGVGMFASSSSGWAAVPLGYEVSYTVGSGTAPAIGATITQGGVSGILKAITIESGTFAANTAKGRMIFASIAGGNFAAGAFTAGITATCSGAQTAITFANQNGRFEFVNANFTGRTGTIKMYGCDGKNRAFEFDGTTLVPLTTGTTPDTPLHIASHKNHLWLAFTSSAISSSLGNPYDWQALTGAAEIACGDDITGFMEQPGASTTAAMAIYCRQKSYMLYGNGSSDWNLVTYSDVSGAIPYSVQKIKDTFVMNARGVTALETTLNYGNFNDASLSQRVTTWLANKRKSTTLTDSHIARDKQQYRLFFADGSGAYFTIGSNVNSMTPILFPNPVTCSCSAETYGGGDELIYFGSTNGYVYQMERGTNFDGAAITYSMTLAFDYGSMYRVLKKYRRMSFEVAGDGNGYAEFTLSYQLDYTTPTGLYPEFVDGSSQVVANYFGNSTYNGSPSSGAVWNVSQNAPVAISTPGDGQSISITITATSAIFTRIRFSGVYLESSPTRQLR